MLGSIGFTELLFIFLIVVILFGASRKSAPDSVVAFRTSRPP